MIEHRTGDLLAPENLWSPPGPAAYRPVMIPHVCNEEGAWGAGFVVALSRRWARPEEAYRQWCAGTWRPRAHPGDYELATHNVALLGAVQYITAEPRRDRAPHVIVANMIAQEGVRRPGNMVPLRYESLRRCLEQVALHAMIADARVIMPRIGAGLAGGDWKRVEQIINETLGAHQLPTAVYTLP